MDVLSSKQKSRIEKKKKKLLALANIVMLNDSDREQDNIIEEQPQSVEDDDDGFIKVTHKKNKAKKTHLDSCSEMPPSKRQKTVDGVDEEKEKVIITDEQYRQIHKELTMRKRKLQKKPTILLRDLGERALLSVKEHERTPIFLTDLQHLVMSTLLGEYSPCTPSRWCLLDRPGDLSHTVVVCVDGLSLFHYLSNENKFKKINKIFEYKLETLMPKTQSGGDGSMALLEEFTQVPLTNIQAHELILKHGSLEAAVELNKDPTLIMKTIFPVEDVPVDPASDELHPNDKFPRTKLLLSALQMVDENYPMPLKGELNTQFSRYVMTKDTYAPVTNRSPLFAVDCEMCKTSLGVNELTRISIVNEDFETVYETLVMPDNAIVNFLTKYSGITKEMMKKVTKKLKDVQREVRELLPADAILIGQSLNFDLNAMQMMHPYVIDTSICFNMSGVRRHKTKLKKLAMTYLQENIQQHESGHDSVEDSRTSLKLVKLKLANSVEFGDEILMRKKRYHDIIRLAQEGLVQNNLLAHASLRDKRTAIVTAKALPTAAQEILQKAEKAIDANSNKCVLLHEVSSNKEAVRKCKEISSENALTLCHLHLTPEELIASSFDATIENVDKWVSKIWNNMAHNGLLLLIMGGASECSSGVANISIKRNIAEVAAKLPVEV